MSLRCQGSDQAFEHRADQRSSRKPSVLRRQMTGLHRGRDARPELVSKRTPERDPHRFHLGFGGICDQGPDQFPLPQRPRRESRDRGGQCRKRAGCGLAGAPDGCDLSLGHDADQRRHKLGLGREIAVDGTGGDARAFSDSGDLHRRHPALRRGNTCRGQDGLMAGGLFPGNLWGAPIGHG
jgi:hypothetical protein